MIYRSWALGRAKWAGVFKFKSNDKSLNSKSRFCWKLRLGVFVYISSRFPWRLLGLYNIMWSVWSVIVVLPVYIPLYQRTALNVRRFFTTRKSVFRKKLSRLINAPEPAMQVYLYVGMKTISFVSRRSQHWTRVIHCSGITPIAATDKSLQPILLLNI